MVSVSRMTTVVFMTGVMLSRVAMAGGVVGRIWVVMLGYRRPRLVGAPGRVATGFAAVAVARMIVRLTHPFTSVLSSAARWT